MKTIFQANKDLGFSFGGTTYSPPATYYIALSTSDTITEEGFTEPVGNGYARVAVTNSTDSFTTASNKSISTKIGISFNISTGTWGTVYAVGIYDAASLGNLLYYQALAVSRDVPADTTLRFESGAITFTET